MIIHNNHWLLLLLWWRLVFPRAWATAAAAEVAGVFAAWLQLFWWPLRPRQSSPQQLPAAELWDGLQRRLGVSLSARRSSQQGANWTGRLQNTGVGQSCLLEEVLDQFVGGVVFAPPHFKRNPIYVADERVWESCCKRLSNIPSSTLSVPRTARHLQKIFDGHL